MRPMTDQYEHIWVFDLFDLMRKQNKRFNCWLLLAVPYTNCLFFLSNVCVIFACVRAWNENTNIWNSHIKIFWAWIVFPIRKWKCSHFNNFSATVRIVRRQQREREANLPGTERLVTKTTRDTCELYSRNRIEKKQRIVVGFESVNWYSWREHINLLLLHVEIRPEFSHND